VTAEIIQFPIDERVSFLGKTITVPSNGLEYLSLCKNNLCLDDYLRICAAIIDADFYEEVEEDLRNIVDCFYELEAFRHDK